MRAVATALLLAAAFVAVLTLARVSLSPFLVAPAAVAVGVAATVTATGGWTWLAVVFGALGPLALVWLGNVSPALALMATSMLWLAPRAWLTRTRRDLTVWGVASVTAAVVAGLIIGYFLDAPLAQHLAACMFAGASLAVTTVVVPVDSPLAHALHVCGLALDGAPRDALVRAADALRHPPRDEAKRHARKEWTTLLKTADARVALAVSEGEDAIAERGELDRDILAQVDKLCGRAHDPGGAATAAFEPKAMEAPEVSPAQQDAQEPRPAEPMASTLVP